MKSLISKFAVPIVGVMAGLLIAAAATSGVFFNLWQESAETAAEQGAEITVLKSEVGSVVAANETNVEVIATLKERLKRCVDSKAADKAASDRAVAAAREEAAILAAQLAAEERKRREDYETPDCRAWADLPVCDARADSLRELLGTDGGSD